MCVVLVDCSVVHTSVEKLEAHMRNDMMGVFTSDQGLIISDPSGAHRIEYMEATELPRRGASNTDCSCGIVVQRCSLLYYVYYYARCSGIQRTGLPFSQQQGLSMGTWSPTHNVILCYESVNAGEHYTHGERNG
jgi:hypothetical protein